MSLCAGTLFVNTGELYLVLAGHPPPLILDSDFNLKSVQFSSKSVGLIGEVDFPEHPEVIKISLSKGDSIFFYTDGLLENAMTASGLSLNRKKLSKKLAELFRRRKNGDFEKNQLPKILMDWTKQDFDSYQMNDDVAILLIHYE
jgi:serine phosphatase RsbU (regulator of sigma subunit)